MSWQTFPGLACIQKTCIQRSDSSGVDETISHITMDHDSLGLAPPIELPEEVGHQEKDVCRTGGLRSQLSARSSKSAGSSRKSGASHSAQPRNFIQATRMAQRSASASSFSSAGATVSGTSDYKNNVPTFDFKHEERKSAVVAVLVLMSLLAIVVGLIIAGDMSEKAVCEGVQSSSLRSCELCSSGTTILPLGGDWEKRWPSGLRIFIYLFGVLWTFLGVGTVCDEFMAGIEAITSREKAVWMPARNGVRNKVHVKVWNATLANLSLMALGSSAPEILLSTIELLSNRCYSGAIGPQTVVGSAAFNLFIITAVCISAIPVNEVRRIEKVTVFAFTATVSVLSYLWLIVILVLITPDKVDMWEALVTLFSFFVFLAIAFYLDKNSLADTKVTRTEEDEIAQLQLMMEEEYGRPVGLQGVRSMYYQQQVKTPKKSKATLRREFSSQLVGGKRSFAYLPTYGFKEPNMAVLECAGTIKVAVHASSPCTVPVFLHWTTKDGVAEAGKRYEPCTGVLLFQPSDVVKYIEVNIIDNETWDPSEEFYVQITKMETPGLDPRKTRLGVDSCAIWVINDDEPGTLDFQSQEVSVEVGTMEVAVSVVRSSGSHGRIRCFFETVDDTATSGVNFKSMAGEVTFEDGQETQQLTVPLIRNGLVPVSFRLRLFNASEGVLFDPATDGGDEYAQCVILLQGRNVAGGVLTSWFAFVHEGRTQLSLTEWREKIGEAFFCNGSAEGQSQAGLLDWLMHCLALFWK
ncbi:unnamed protein product, partial [Polarella glacialis]